MLTAQIMLNPVDTCGVLCDLPSFHRGKGFIFLGHIKSNEVLKENGYPDIPTEIS
jgi:hypothetical protein